MTARDDRLSGSSHEDWRGPAQRDLDRILYASSYRRLAGVTQVLPASEQPILHNRLTHTLKVEQVARRTAQRLIALTPPEVLDRAGGLSPDTAAAAAAAHDLGHPPFGHIAENELQDLLKGKDGLPDSFEGNAQSFRIVTKLAVRKLSPSGSGADGLGLDLTLATLAALLKYPWVKGGHAARGAPDHTHEYYGRKWGAYASEADALHRALAVVPEGRFRSLEAEVMDYADDVTYAVHDIEDFYRVGLIPLHEIGLGAQDGKSRIFADFWDFACAEINAKGEVDFDPALARERLERLAPLMPDLPYQDTDADRLNLHRFISSTVGAMMDGTKIGPQGAFIFDGGSRMLIEVLKQLTWFFVIEHPALAAAQRGQQTIVRELVQWLNQWARDNDPEGVVPHAKKTKIKRRRVRELPARLLSYIDAGVRDAEMTADPYTHEQIRLRAVVDFVSSLTEPAAYDLHGRLGGTDPSSLVVAGLRR